MANRRYERLLIMLKADTYGYSTDQGKIMGHCILEIRNGKCKLNLFVQNIAPLKKNNVYKVFLVAADGKMSLGVNCGVIPIDDRGKGELKYELDPDNVGGSGRKIEQFNVVTILLRDTSNSTKEIIAPLTGYMSEKRLWKNTFEIFTHEKAAPATEMVVLPEITPEDKQALTQMPTEERQTPLDILTEEKQVHPDIPMEEKQVPLDIPTEQNKQAIPDISTEKKQPLQDITTEEKQALADIPREQNKQALLDIQTEEKQALPDIPTEHKQALPDILTEEKQPLLDITAEDKQPLPDITTEDMEEISLSVEFLPDDEPLIMIEIPPNEQSTSQDQPNSNKTITQMQINTEQVIPDKPFVTENSEEAEAFAEAESAFLQNDQNNSNTEENAVFTAVPQPQEAPQLSEDYSVQSFVAPLPDGYNIQSFVDPLPEQQLHDTSAFTSGGSISTSETEKPSDIEPDNCIDLKMVDLCNISDIGNIFASNPSMDPLKRQSQRYEWVRIGLEEFALLPVNSWEYTKNPFVLAGYKKFNHLILGRISDGSLNKLHLLIGVPGVYRPSLKLRAEKLGFKQFKCIDDKTPTAGDYGYWIIRIM